MATFSSCAKGMVMQNVISAMYSILSTGAIDWGRLYLREEDEGDAAAVADMLTHLNEVVKRVASERLQRGDNTVLSDFWATVMSEMREWSEVPAPHVCSVRVLAINIVLGSYDTRGEESGGCSSLAYA